MVRRSKKKFKTSRSAWMDIAKKTRLKPNQVKSQHTRTEWVWVNK